MFLKSELYNVFSPHISPGKTLTELTTMFEKKEKLVSNSNQSTHTGQYLSKEEEAEAKNIMIRDFKWICVGFFKVLKQILIYMGSK